MMKILYLYHDLMNLYGDNGNVKAMCRHLANQGFDVELDKKTVSDMLDFSIYDFIYCGSGTERNQKVALTHLKQYGDGFREAVERGTVFLFTGNALEMLGARIVGTDDKVYEGLGLLPFHVKENHDKRYTGDAIFRAQEFDGDVVGFVNKCSDLTDLSEENALFAVEMGKGNDAEDRLEGIRLNHCFGTYLTGPVCVKNPHVLKYLITLIGKKEYSDFIYHDKDSEYEKNSYEVTLNALKVRQQNERRR